MKTTNAVFVFAFFILSTDSSIPPDYDAENDDFYYDSPIPIPPKSEDYWENIDGELPLAGEENKEHQEDWERRKSILQVAPPKKEKIKNISLYRHHLFFSNKKRIL